MKTPNSGNPEVMEENVGDIGLTIAGDGTLFRLLCKASSEAEGWMESTKAMQAGNGCVVQVTTQQRNLDGSYTIAEALTFVPNVVIVSNEGNGYRLV